MTLEEIKKLSDLAANGSELRTIWFRIEDKDHVCLTAYKNPLSLLDKLSQEEKSEPISKQQCWSCGKR